MIQPIYFWGWSLAEPSHRVTRDFLGWCSSKPCHQSAPNQFLALIRPWFCMTRSCQIWLVMQALTHQQEDLETHHKLYERHNTRTFVYKLSRSRSCLRARLGPTHDCDLLELQEAAKSPRARQTYKLSTLRTASEGRYKSVGCVTYNRVRTSAMKVWVEVMSDEETQTSAGFVCVCLYLFTQRQYLNDISGSNTSATSACYVQHRDTQIGS